MVGARADVDAEELVRRIFGAWLSATALHGCYFATWAAKRARLRLGVFFDRVTESTAADLTRHFELAREDQQFGVALFPRVISAPHVCRLLEVLTCSDRWRYALRDDVPRRAAVDLRWQSPAMEECSALGFAPIGAMPVTRRAPYTAFGLWPGGHDNPLRQKPDAFVGAGDMAHDLDSEVYRRMHAETRGAVEMRRAVLREAGVITGVTFCLPRVYRPRLELHARGRTS